MGKIIKTKQLASHLAAAFASVAASSASDLQFNHLWTFNHVAANGSAAMGSEIVSYDATHNHLWVVGTDVNAANNGLGGLDVLDLSGNVIQAIDLSVYGAPNSVATKNGQAAVAITAPVKTDPGLVKFFDAGTFSLLSSVTVGANPDAVTFTPDGGRLLVANEGEPSTYLSPGGDPEGSVSIINAATYAVQTAGFGSFDATALKNAGVRLNGPGATVAQDLEPEYIGVSADGSRALVTLQEANAVALVDVASATVTAIQPMGLKDHSLPGRGLDVSDQDGVSGNIQPWLVKGMYMPDGIANLSKNGQDYYVVANEGDSRADWPGGNDEFRVSTRQIEPALETALIAAHGADWKSNAKLGRLNVSNSGDLDGNGKLDELQAFGGRSFSILDANGNMVFDSGDQIEQIVKARYPSLWDDGRSDNKGPEPESAVLGTVDGRDLLFLGLERSNAVMVWDVTDLNSIMFLNMLFTQGDVGPEGLSFFQNSEGSFLAVANEVSETTTLYQITVPAGDPSTGWLLGSAVLGMIGLLRRRA